MSPPTSSVLPPVVYVDNTGFNSESYLSAKQIPNTTDEGKTEDQWMCIPRVYIDNNEFDFRFYKPLGQFSILECFVYCIGGLELRDLLLSHLTKGEDLLNLSLVNPKFRKFLSNYFPKRVKDNPNKITFPKLFKSTLQRDEFSQNRSLSILFWLTQKCPDVSQAAKERLLTLPGYQIKLTGDAPNRTAQIGAKMIKACTGRSATASLFATSAEDHFQEKHQIGSDEWKQMLKQNNIVYATFSTQTESGEVQFLIPPVYRLWLNYPDADTQIQNAAHLTRIIHSAISTQDEDYQAQAGRIFAEFLIHHPIRDQEATFTRILAMIIAEFRVMSFGHTLHPLWPTFSAVFNDTLSQDGRYSDPATLLESAIILSREITVPLPWKPIQSIAKYLDEIGKNYA